MTTDRTAACGCGRFTAATQGDPYVVSLCNCTECQRRSGSPFGVGAYFKREQVTLDGEHRSWTRQGSSGADLTNLFCATCGTNLAWTTALHPGAIAVAVGCFADPDFPAPARSVWEATRHRWFEPPVVDRFVESSGGLRVTPSA
jgi:hypothetical protein